MTYIYFKRHALPFLTTHNTLQFEYTIDHSLTKQTLNEAASFKESMNKKNWDDI